MSEMTVNIDPALLAEFIDESADMLAGLDHLFVELERCPEDLSIIEAVFRPTHSIKGNSAFFGLMRIKNLAHELESILDKARKRGLRIDPPLISILLKGYDALKAMFDRVRGGQAELEDNAAYEQLLAQVRAFAGGGPPASPAPSAGAAGDAAFWRQLLQETENLSGRLQGHEDELSISFLQLISKIQTLAPEAGPPQARRPATTQAAGTESISDLIDEVRGLIAAPGDPDVARTAHIQSSIERLHEGLTVQTDRAAAADILDTFKTFSATVGLDDLARELLIEKLMQLSRDHHAHPAAAPSAPATSPSAGPTSPAGPDAEARNPSPAAPPTGEAHAKVEAAKTMRVSESHIDSFLGFVGELLVVGDMFGHLQQRMARGDAPIKLLPELRRANDTFSKLSAELQREIMSIRKVPVRALLQKVPRLVRDVAARSAKSIQTEITGEDVLIDKSLMDLLDAPLTHMVRNAADHGVETPDKRQARGKPPAGVVKVSITESATSIVLSVGDDGEGLNFPAITAKAVSLGMITPDKTLTEEQIIDLIFASGVSTAQTVTDVSGRGVGMDVVKRMIIDAGGSISVRTDAGHGSTFTVQVPKSVTTQIMNGFLVSVAGQPYVLPMEKVLEAVCLPDEQVNSISGKGRCIVRHDHVLPVISVSRVLGQPGRDQASKQPHILVTVMRGRNPVALEVDNLLGVRQVVLRQIQGIEKQSRSVIGGALLGDGSVALILDVDQLDEPSHPSDLS